MLHAYFCVYLLSNERGSTLAYANFFCMMANDATLVPFNHRSAEQLGGPRCANRFLWNCMQARPCQSI